MGTVTPTASQVVLRAVSTQIPASRLLTAADSTDRFRADQGAWAPAGTPAAVVLAESSEDVQHVVRACYDHGVPVVARGAGTGLSGGANAVDGCVVVSLERMDAVLEVNPLERLAVVQPGVVNDHLRERVAREDLWYPPDPASSPWSTIGGNVATNAGGLCCVKYGVTGDYVLALEVVTGTGELVRLGRRTAKGVAGYDLVALLVGSEGTLGIVTEVTVRLRPLPAPRRTIAAFFGSRGRRRPGRRARRPRRAHPGGARAGRQALSRSGRRVEEHGAGRRGRRRAARAGRRPRGRR